MTRRDGAVADAQLHVRSYCDDPVALLFFEVKKRVGAALLKCRAPVSREQARMLLSGRATIGSPLHHDLPAPLEELTALAAVAQMMSRA